MRGATSEDLYHAMIYVSGLEASKAYYRRFGLKTVAACEGCVRLRFPGGMGTLALHHEPGRGLGASGIRLYFESDAIDVTYGHLVEAGIKFYQPLATMPWGWKHAYTQDPVGHEIGLFSAGASRLEQK